MKKLTLWFRGNETILARNVLSLYHSQWNWSHWYPYFATWYTVMELRYVSFVFHISKIECDGNEQTKFQLKSKNRVNGRPPGFRAYRRLFQVKPTILIQRNIYPNTRKTLITNTLKDKLNKYGYYTTNTGTHARKMASS